MCGLAGCVVVGRGGFRVTQAYLERMEAILAHRGPDGKGLWLSPDGKVGLAHRRLAIIDPAPHASQPMSNEDGSLWLVYNGEIYNHAELRRELEALGGHRWRTDHADSEVVLHAFEQWGIDCLRRFRGMFAFALWDARREELWLVRDRLGIKPLYYSLHHGRLVFASEIKALLRDPQQERAVDERSLFHFLSFLTTPAPYTLFQGIRKLPPACWLRVGRSGSVQLQRYWDPWEELTPLPGIGEAEAAQRVLAVLEEAVRLRTVSDMPVGVFLSGGLDSSTNAVLFARHWRQEVKTFSIGYQGEFASYPDELPYARLVARRVGARHHERRLELEDLLRFLPRMVWLQDEPIADPVCVPVYYLAELARRHGVVVCQVGEGADELFWGYPVWRTLLRLERLNRLPLSGGLKALGLRVLAALGRDCGQPYELLRRGRLGLPLFWSGAEAFSETHKRRLLSARLRRRFARTSSWEVMEPWYRRFRRRAWEPSRLNWMTYADLNLRLPELLLMRVDKMTMGVALEARVPFLDHRLVELALAIPTRLKTRRGQLKHILKRAVADLLPPPVLARPKQGFGVPVHEWFRRRLGREMARELRQFCRRTDYLDPGEVERVLERGSAMQAWYLFNLALWWRAMVAGEPGEAPA
jgi:asparagine synthase (glutamine-hydrolysing)